jgi:hypothetical protein
MKMLARGFCAALWDANPIAWSTNPLATLFFACDGGVGHDGYVYAMDARKMIPDDALKLLGSRIRLRGNPACYPFGLTWFQVELVSKVRASHFACTAQIRLIIPH